MDRQLLGLGEVDHGDPWPAVDPARHLHRQRRSVGEGDASQVGRQLCQRPLSLLDSHPDRAGQVGDSDRGTEGRLLAILQHVLPCASDIGGDRATAGFQFLQVGAHRCACPGHGAPGRDDPGRQRLPLAVGGADVRREVQDHSQRPHQQRRHRGRMDDHLTVLAALLSEPIAQEVDDRCPGVLPGWHHQLVLGQQERRIGPDPGDREQPSFVVRVSPALLA